MSDGSRAAAPRVLIVDNEPVLVMMLVEGLRRVGIQAVACHGGAEAAARVAADRIPLVVCDLDMPDVPGEVVVEALACLAPPPRVVIMSGFVGAATRTRLEATGRVAAVLLKPFDLVEFTGKIANLLAAADAGGTPATGVLFS